MLKLVITAAFCFVAVTAYGQYAPQPYYPAPQPVYPYPYQPEPEPYYPAPAQPRSHSSGLSAKCAEASRRIKNNDCGPEGCDRGLCVALRYGCHINSWGHHCPGYSQ